MQRKCHFCGRVETNDIARYCTDCGQEFIVPPKLPLSVRLVAMFSYCTILGAVVSLFFNRKNEFIKFHRKHSLIIQRDFIIVLLLVCCCVLFISGNSWWFVGTVFILVCIFQVILPLVGIIYSMKGLYKSYRSPLLIVLALLSL